MVSKKNVPPKKLKKPDVINAEVTTKRSSLSDKVTKQKKTKIVSEKAIDAYILTEKKKKSKLVMPSKYVTENIVLSCLNRLDQVAASSKKKNLIFEDEQPIFLEIHCIKIQTTRGNFRFVLPHSTAASTGEICLITPDLKKGKKIDHEPTIDHWEEILKKAGVTSVKTVLPLRQLKVEYDQFELKRRLMTQHDFIMIDTRILNNACHILGKMFFKKHNMLIPVRINETGSIKKDIDVGLRTSILRLSEGATSVIVVGHTSMSKNKLKDNILSLIQQLKEKYPGGEVNIRSLALKLPLSVSLPLYMTLRPSNTVSCAPKIRKIKPHNFKDIEDELSTVPNSNVKVSPDGTVHIIKKKPSMTADSEEESEYDSQFDETNSSDQEGPTNE
ncbi:hypothetical protein ACJJTC_004050 [Scirpophaga incertulas]